MNNSSVLLADTQHQDNYGPRDDSREATLSVLMTLFCTFCGFLIIAYIIHWVQVVNYIFDKKKMEEKDMKVVPNNRTMFSIRFPDYGPCIH